jgi:hypothetical protein
VERLSVGEREHATLPVGICHRADNRDERGEFRTDYALQCVVNQHAVREIVDVFARKPEVNEFCSHLEPCGAFDAFFQVILDRLHVVLRFLFDGTNAFDVAVVETIHDILQGFFLFLRESFEFTHALFIRERRKVADLDEHARPHQRFFGKKRAQRINLMLVPSVERREGMHAPILPKESLLSPVGSRKDDLNFCRRPPKIPRRSSFPSSAEFRRALRASCGAL